MATSGVATIQYTRDQLIQMALRKLSVLAKGQVPDTEDYTNSTQAFNLLIAEFRALGMPLWARNSYTITPVASTSSYTIGTGQTLNTPYPLKLHQAVYTPSGGTNYNIDIIADYNFNLLPTNSSGKPIQMTYQPKNNLGVIKVWPTPTSAETSDTITIVYQRPFEYMTATGDTLDMPEEWYTPIVYGLATRLAPEWGIGLPDRQTLAKEAEMYLQRVLDMGFEDATLTFQPDTRWMPR
jgi:hypothetical protein